MEFILDFSNPVFIIVARDGQGTQSDEINLLYTFLMATEPKDSGGNSEQLLLKGVIILKYKLNQQNFSFLGWPFVWF